MLWVLYSHSSACCECCAATAVFALWVLCSHSSVCCVCCAATAVYAVSAVQPPQCMLWVLCSHSSVCCVCCAVYASHFARMLQTVAASLSTQFNLLMVILLRICIARRFFFPCLIITAMRYPDKTRQNVYLSNNFQILVRKINYPFKASYTALH